MPNKRVKVSFFRANRSVSHDDWSWPDEPNDIGQWVTAEFDRRTGEGVDPIVQSFGKETLVEVHHRGGSPQVGASSVRNDNLPFVLRHGASSGEPLDIDSRDRLLEPSYLTFLPNRIVAFVRGTATPGHRASAISIARVANVAIQLDPIINPDVLLMIQRGQAVASIDLTVAAGSVDQAAFVDDPVAAASQLAANVGGTQTVSVALRASDPGSRRRLRTTLLHLLERRGTADLESANVGLFTQDGVYEVVDLLEQDLVTRMNVEVDTHTRHLMPEDAQTAALQAYDESLVLLTHAIALAD